MRNKMTVIATLISLLFLGGTASGQTVDCRDDAGNPCDDGSIAVPEPGTLVLLATGLAGIALTRKRKKR